MHVYLNPAVLESWKNFFTISYMMISSVCSHPNPNSRPFLFNNLPDNTQSQCKLGELWRLACPPSHPDNPDHSITTCGASSWAANKPYFTPAPLQADHFSLVSHSERRLFRAKFTVAADASGKLRCRVSNVIYSVRKSNI